MPGLVRHPITQLPVLPAIFLIIAHEPLKLKFLRIVCLPVRRIRYPRVPIRSRALLVACLHGQLAFAR